MKLLLILIALLPTLALADYDVKVTVGLYTLHTPDTCVPPPHEHCNGYNTDNDLVVLSFDNLFFGHMTNSYFNESWIVGAKHTERLGQFDLTGGLLLATGYPKYIMPGGRTPDMNSETVLAGVMAQVAYNVTPNFSIDFTTQLTALSVGIGCRL